ncbi:MAG: HlyD family secretion protein [Anaerolineae bacterium]
MKRFRQWILLGIALAGALTLAGCGTGSEALFQKEPTATPLPVVQEASGVVAEGRIVPRQWVWLSPAASGDVAEILVEEGAEVTEGQLLLRIADSQQRAAVDEAEAGVQMAEAQLAQIRATADAEKIAAAQADVDTARGGVQSASAAVAAAQAKLTQLQAGATTEETAIAEHNVEAAKNALWSAQTQRDSVCSQGSQANCDAANATVQQADEAMRIAELQLQQVRNGAGAEDVLAAQAAVNQAQGELGAARATQAKAEAGLALLNKGASAEAIVVAEAQVSQARAALVRAQASLADTELRAPAAGRIAQVSAKEGEKIAPTSPAMLLANLSSWQVETDDLTEMDVVHVRVGQQVTLIPDALPELRIVGTVETIEDVFEEKQGDVTYTVRIRFDEADPRLRWGMTVQVNLESPEG